ncbi:hypothetical protein AM571_PA00171 (plasmid) [Rhizobium etli 8C-3]|uniref:Uncharacterized protein n=1 Tax=Rhizobium etli 8C-3 TaxID=538025 RepID=A0A1L5PA38_RHIET|nr:hypothetical protein AM571_PA00171 [Rhizobium etli 8C-3]
MQALGSDRQLEIGLSQRPETWFHETRCQAARRPPGQISERMVEALGLDHRPTSIIERPATVEEVANMWSMSPSPSPPPRPVRR